MTSNSYWLVVHSVVKTSQNKIGCQVMSASRQNAWRARAIDRPAGRKELKLHISQNNSKKYGIYQNEVLVGPNIS